MAPGHVRLSLAIETPRGLLRAEAIAASSDRIATMGVGVEDYCLELGVEPSADGIELLYPVARVVTIAKAAGIQPTGLMGSVAGFRDLVAFEGAAARARQLGCEGAGCIHPDQVAVLNRVFYRIPPTSSTRGGSSRRSRTGSGEGRPPSTSTAGWWTSRCTSARR